MLEKFKWGYRATLCESVDGKQSRTVLSYASTVRNTYWGYRDLNSDRKVPNLASYQVRK